MTTENYDSIHSVYCSITNRPVLYDTRKFFAWQAWQAMGWTEEDLRLVVAFILRRIKTGKRRPESLRFTLLIEDHSRFEDDVLDARMEARQSQNQPTPRARALSSVGRTEPEPERCRSVDSIMAESKALAEFRAMRDAL